MKEQIRSEETGTESERQLTKHLLFWFGLLFFGLMECYIRAPPPFFFFSISAPLSHLRNFRTETSLNTSTCLLLSLSLSFLSYLRSSGLESAKEYKANISLPFAQYHPSLSLSPLTPSFSPAQCLSLFLAEVKSQKMKEDSVGPGQCPISPRRRILNGCGKKETGNR